jgi:hypothetical protein
LVKSAPNIELHGDELSPAHESTLYYHHHHQLNYTHPRPNPAADSPAADADPGVQVTPEPSRTALKSRRECAASRRWIQLLTSGAVRTSASAAVFVSWLQAAPVSVQEDGMITNASRLDGLRGAGCRPGGYWE